MKVNTTPRNNKLDIRKGTKFFSVFSGNIVINDEVVNILYPSKLRKSNFMKLSAVAENDNLMLIVRVYFAEKLLG